ncbi:hypothetical protein HK102_012071, partial [Quaeritorhiza haematococci]
SPLGTPTQTQTLHSTLSLATSYYKSLILSLSTRESLDLLSFGAHLYAQKNLTEGGITRNTDTKRGNVFAVIVKSVVFLGDLARYGAMYVNEGEGGEGGGQWDLAQSLYRKAIRLNPDRGKPYSQLAIIATHRGDYLDTVYWYSL